MLYEGLNVSFSETLKVFLLFSLVFNQRVKTAGALPPTFDEHCPFSYHPVTEKGSVMRKRIDVL